MKKTQIKFNVVITIIAICFVAVMLLTNVGYASIPVATVKGSYADTFAKEHHLKTIELADTQKMFADFRYESFNYNTNDDGGITIENYDGDSSSIVIPYMINGRVVTRIGEKFFANNSVINEVYIPVTLIKIEGEVNDRVIIYTDKDSRLLAETEDNDKKNDKKWRIEAIYDSDLINYLNGDIPFEYNIVKNEIEIVEYTGNDDIIIIPSYINGKAVTKVSFDMLGNYKGIVFPETVKSITGEVSKVLFTISFAIELAFSVIAFLLVIILINVVFPNMKRYEEIQSTSPQIILCFSYLIIQLIFSVLVIRLEIVGSAVALIISLVWLMIFIITMLMAKTGKSYQEEVSENIKSRTEVMRSIKKSVIGLSDDISDLETKKIVDRLIEDIKYSSNGSKNPEIEEQIANEISLLKSNIKSEDNEEIISKCKVIRSLMEQR